MSTIVLMLSVSLTASATGGSREHVIYPFFGFPDCNSPAAPLAADQNGNLYGSALEGGLYGKGCIFKLSSNPDGSWAEAVLYSFSGLDGYAPAGALVFDTLGNLYGTTERGGTYDAGVAFKLSPSVGGTWRETVLYNFGNGDDGTTPRSELVFDSAGNLYGTTEFGGPRRGGTVFRLSPGPNGWTETILHAFIGRIQGPDPCSPFGGVVMDSEGNLYGVTGFGGANGGFGAAYELLPKNGVYKERTIHNFDGFDGWLPSSSLIMDSSGNLYGTTDAGGSRLDICPGVGCGTVFELTKSGWKWTESVLYSLGDNGASAFGPVVFGDRGNLYAAAQSGGIAGQGSVFKLTPNGDGTWTEHVVHLFRYHDAHFRHFGPDGQIPYAGVIVNGGNLFGTTSSGGVNDEGTVFEIDLK